MLDKPTHTISVIGRCGSGKSTLVGQLLYRLGSISDVEMQAVEKRANELGRPSHKFAFLLNRTRQERECGTTKHLSYRHVETKHYFLNLIDTPGNAYYMERTFRGILQSSVVIAIVDVNQTDLEESLNRLVGMLKQCLVTSRANLTQIICCVNGMDDPTIDYSEQLFLHTATKITQFLKRLGCKERIECIPISAYCGDNIVEPSLNTPWYFGNTLLDALNSLKPAIDHSNSCLRLPITEIHKMRNIGTVIYGKIETGIVRLDTKIQFSDSTIQNVKIKSIQIFGKSVVEAKSGQIVAINLVYVDHRALRKGSVIFDCDPPGKLTRFFEAKILFFSHPSTIKEGYKPTIQIQSEQVRCKIRKIKETRTSLNELISNNPTEIRMGQFGTVDCELDRPIYLEHSPPFCRFIVRDLRRLIGAGNVLEFLE